jgi:hypothetical protein
VDYIAELIEKHDMDGEQAAMNGQVITHFMNSDAAKKNKLQVIAKKT